MTGTTSTEVLAREPEPAPATARDPERKAYVIRVATVYLCVGHDDQDRSEYADKLVSALQADARVTQAWAPEMDREWSPQFVVYVPVDDDDEGLLEATRHTHVQRLARPVAFSLRVPKKNQPKVFEDDEVPSERYFALWDGQTLLVAWEQDAGKAVGSSGGHVIEEILEAVAERMGAAIMVQACNAQCKYVFIHMALRVLVDPAAEVTWAISRDQNDRGLLEVVLTSGDDVLDVALSAWYRIEGCCRVFARMKNLGRHILELERLVRRDLNALNRIHYERANSARRGLPRRAQSYWKNRGWRSQSRYHLARVWLGLSNLELLRRAWSDEAFDFRRATEEDGLTELFAIDTHDEVSLVEQLDLTLIEASVEHAEDRLTASALVVATAYGAVAGAIVAAVFSLVLG